MSEIKIEKVRSHLIKWGNNPKKVEEMINGGEWAFRSYSAPRTIAEAIINTHGVCGVER